MACTAGSFVVLGLLHKVGALLLKKFAERVIVFELDPILGHEEIVVEHG
jgi:hypothetical protein